MPPTRRKSLGDAPGSGKKSRTMLDYTSKVSAEIEGPTKEFREWLWVTEFFLQCEVCAFWF